MINSLGLCLYLLRSDIVKRETASQNTMAGKGKGIIDPWNALARAMPPRTDKEVVAVWFSCGAASAVAAAKTLELLGNTHAVRIVNNPVEEEDSDNRRFLDDVQNWLGHPIEIAINPDFAHCSAEMVWEQRRFMSGPLGAPCTIELKKRARQHWEANNYCDWHVLGFTVDEVTRYERFIESERSNVLPILINLGITKQDCADILLAAGIKLPRVYSLGYPNANCIGCVKATSPTYWNHVRRQHPEVFRRRASQSRDIGARLVRVRNERIFLDELDPSEKGKPMKTMSIDCGIFCEEG